MCREERQKKKEKGSGSAEEKKGIESKSWAEGVVRWCILCRSVGGSIDRSIDQQSLWALALDMANRAFPVASSGSAATAAATLFPSASLPPPPQPHCLSGSPLATVDTECSGRAGGGEASGAMTATAVATSGSTAAAVSLRRVLHSIGTRTASLASLAEVMQNHWAKGVSVLVFECGVYAKE